MSMGNEQFQTEDEALFAEAPSSFDAPEGQQQAPEQAAAPQGQSAEPFEGFGALPETARSRFLETMERAKKLEQDLEVRHRQYGALENRVKPLQRQLDELKRTAAAPSSAQAPAVSAEAWEAFKAAFPEDAKAIEQSQAALKAEFGSKLTPMEQQLKELAERTERFEELARQAENEEIRETMSELVPDWKIIAGWQTPDGQDVPADKQAVAPEFSAWMEALPQHVSSSFGAALNSRDPEQMAYVLNAFKRDYYVMLLEEESAAPQQNNQQASPRAAAMRDVMPSATGNSLGSTGRQQAMTAQEREWIEATSGDLMNKWRNAKTG